MPNRYFMFAASAVILSTALSAQSQNLATSRKSSYYTAIYQLDEDQAYRLYKNIGAMDSTFLTRLLDLYPTDSTYHKPLPPGHYAFVRADNQYLHGTLKSVNPVDMKLLNNHRDLMLLLYDSLGREVSDAQVKLRARPIAFDPATHTYRVRRSNKRGIIKVHYGGHTAYFPVSRRFNNTFVIRTGKKLLHIPLNHIASPFYYVYHNVRNVVRFGSSPHAPGIYRRMAQIIKRTQETKGYIAFNKPEYQPGDTVRFKAFMTYRNGRPYKRPVNIKLIQTYPGRMQKKLAVLKPFRPGAYQFAFALCDTLKLGLDLKYDIALVHKRHRLSSSFTYADYELKQNVYTARSEQPHPAKPAILFLKGTDSNDMPLYDIRVEVIIRPTGIQRYFEPAVFVADTLWHYSTRLEPLGETRITLPDSIMPPVMMAYDAQVNFLNTENERVEKTLHLQINRRPFPITLDIRADSLVVSSIDSTMHGVEVTLKQRTAHDESEKTIAIPYAEKINTFAEQYIAVYGDGMTSLRTADKPDQLQVFAHRTSDSLFITTDNPRRITFRYFLFNNSRLVQASAAETLTLKRRVSLRDHYTLSVQYVWGGSPQTGEYEIAYDKRNLDIKLLHAPVVYPGQQTDFTVTVHNAAGKPVADVDLTAFAVTKKFDASAAVSVPSFAIPFRSRKIFNEFNPRETPTVTRKYLDHARWRKVLGLDSLLFFQFLFPNGGYFETRATSEHTEFAPFVIRWGEIQTIHVIYVDGRPVYFDHANAVGPYAFAATPGKHRIELRLWNELIVIPDVIIRRGEKLIFSVDRNHLPVRCQRYERPPAPTRDEITQLSRHYVPVRFNTHNGYAYLRQGSRYYMLGPQPQSSNTQPLAGPFDMGVMQYVTYHGDNMQFDYEPFYQYDIKNNLLKLRSWDMSNTIKNWHWQNINKPAFADHVSTRESIVDFWKNQEELNLRLRRFPDIKPEASSAGQLLLEGMPNDVPGSAIQCTFIVDLQNPNAYTIIPGLPHHTPLREGLYHATVILKNGQFFKIDSMPVQRHGINYYNLRSKTFHAADTFSLRLLKLTRQWSAHVNVYSPQERELQLQDVRSLYYQQTDPAFRHLAQGRIVDDKGKGIPGVNVVIKGTTVGTVTDANGYYSLQAPENGTLVYSFIGYQSAEKPIDTSQSATVSLTPDITYLSEVVVVAYSDITTRMMTGSIVTVRGRVQGIQVTGTVHDSVKMKIRGINVMEASQRPLVIVDGVPMQLDAFDKDRYTSTVVLKGEEAMALFGSKGANGVILLSTKPGASRTYMVQTAAASMALQTEVPGNALRRNFRDYAFWQPDLKTDAEGKAQFRATFPDDITGWNAYVLGMAPHKRTGQTASVIQSYKPMIAQIAQPHFLIEGDEATAVGKITSYKEGKIGLDRTIRISGREPNTQTLTLENTHTDSLHLQALQRDSLAVEYMVRYGTYKDGELRKIPVYRKGVTEASGIFVPLESDTTLSLQLNPARGPVNIYAEADLIDVLMQEIGYLKNYPYTCNEQTASRLRALLLEKQICEYRREKFNDQDEINKMIRRLISHQKDDGSWSWWKNGESEVWITLHVARALSKAEGMGISAPFDNAKTINYLESQLAGLQGISHSDVLLYLAEQGERPAEDEIKTLQKRRMFSSVYQRLSAERLLQALGEPVDWNWIDSTRRETEKGNYYWGEDRYKLWDNAIHNTLLVYQMMVKDKRDNVTLAKVKNYFLESRKTHWCNTYESSLIIEALLPGLLQRRGTLAAPRLILSGSVNKTITEFPVSLQAGADLKISKTGDAPVYLTAFQEYWNPQPERSEKDFVVDTYFDNHTQQLTAGKPIKLNVRITVKRDAEFVMIEIPIPAGCSYQTKKQERTQGEVHREYYHYKTNIYCKYLKKGAYNYTIDLLPRYSGKYTLNPAVAECMYFPTIYGREEIRKIEVR